MHIGVPTEVKAQEARVALVPAAVAELVEAGHHVHIQAGAGVLSGFSDYEYQQAGAHIAADAATLYAEAELIVKVKEPLAEDLQYLTSKHFLFCYLHLAADPGLVEALKKIGLIAIGFETVHSGGKTPLLAPMSAIAGRIAVQIGCRALHSAQGGRGTLLGGTSTNPAGQVVVLGAGVAGMEAAIAAAGLGANVHVLDIHADKLDKLRHQHAHIHFQASTPTALEALLPETDLLIGAVYLVGRRAPVLVSARQMALMPKGAVAVDIAIDQGGCFETSQPCTHARPTYVHNDSGVIHSCVANLPAAAPRTASIHLSTAVLPYVHQIATDQWSEALMAAVNIRGGQLCIAL